MVDLVMMGETKLIIARESNINVEIFHYLTEILQNLNINIAGIHEGNLITLMKHYYLEKWCYESTNTAIVFFKDSDFIERGSIVVYPNERFPHAWILFFFQNKKYVLDLALNIVCEKELYDSLFMPHIEGYSSSIKTRDYLIEKLLNPPKREYSEGAIKFLKRLCGESLENKKCEVEILGSNCIFDPMYHGNVGYTGIIEHNKIKSLSAHFYEGEFYL